MNELGAMMDRLTVTATSPDRTVRLTGNLHGDVGVELAPGCLRRHTEESLARQVAATARVGIAALRQGYERAVAASAGPASGA